MEISLKHCPSQTVRAFKGQFMEKLHLTGPHIPPLINLSLLLKPSNLYLRIGVKAGGPPFFKPKLDIYLFLCRHVPLAEKPLVV